MAVVVDEPGWIRRRVEHLQEIRTIFSDEQALDAIDALIAEAKERLTDLEHAGFGVDGGGWGGLGGAGIGVEL